MKTIFLALLVAAGFLSEAQTTGGNDYLLLPENLAYFTAVRSGKTISLEWQTINEQNAKGFAVQRQTAGEWETLAFAVTKALNGNSSAKIAYAYTDANSFKGITQYRIVQVTNDGKQRRSEIRAVKGESQTGNVLLYPNPCTDGRLNLLFDDSSPKDVWITDASGRTVKQLAGMTTTTVVVENLPPGFYTVCVIDRATKETAVLKAVVNPQTP